MHRLIIHMSITSHDGTDVSQQDSQVQLVSHPFHVYQSFMDCSSNLCTSHQLLKLSLPIWLSTSRTSRFFKEQVLLFSACRTENSNSPLGIINYNQFKSVTSVVGCGCGLCSCCCSCCTACTCRVVSSFK